MITIQKITSSEANGFASLTAKLASQTKFMMREPSEANLTEAAAKLMIVNVEKEDNFLYVAKKGKQVVGFMSATKGTFIRTKHLAYIVVGILAEYSGQGIGQRFMDELNQWATGQKLRRLELTVMTHNYNAIRLYEKNGFVKEGVKKDAMFIDGQFVDEFYMARIL